MLRVESPQRADSPARHHSCALLALASVCIGSAGASAQTADSTEPVRLEEITVTATRRAEPLAEVPASVSAVTGLELRERSATDYRDFIKDIPGVFMSDYGEGRTNLIFRGLATAPDDQNGTVASYYNDIFLGAGNGAPEAAFFDVERIEFLRGPQGTLYGASSLGGALKIVTKRPDLTTTGGYVQGTTYGMRDGNGAGHQMEGAFNPVLITDKLAVRMGGYEYSDPDFIKNPLLGTKVGGTERHGERISALYQPTERLSFLGEVQRSDAYTNGSAEGDLATPFVSGRQKEFANQRLDLASGTVAYDFGPATLTSVTGFTDSRAFAWQDQSQQLNLLSKPAGTTIFIGQGDRDLQRISQELRLQSTQGKLFDWTVGMYYESLHTRTANTRLFPQIPPPGDRVGGVPSYSKREQSAGFADVSWHITDKLTASAGARYSRIRGSQVDTGVTSDTAVIPDTMVSTFLQIKDNVVTPRLNLSYQRTADELYYVEASKGYRPGDLNFPSSGDCLIDPHFPQDFKSDTLRNYDFGTKLFFLNRRLSVFADVFYDEWRNMPMFSSYTEQRPDLYPECTLETPEVNLGKARSYGGDLEVRAYPQESLSVGVRGGYTSTELLDAGDPALGNFTVGQSLATAPKYTLSADLTKEFPIFGRFRGFVSANYLYVPHYTAYLSDDWAFFVLFGTVAKGNWPAVQPRLGGYSQVDLRFGMRSGQWSGYLYTKNLFDSKGLTNLRGAPAQDVPQIASQRPRTVGLTLAWNF